jgi:hypothetical protein
MKKLLFLTIALLICFNTNAQNIDNVNIGVVCPEQVDCWSPSCISQLRNKIEQIVASNGISTYMDGNFVVYPVLEFYGSKYVEGGMRKVLVLDMGLTLFIKQLSTGMIANSVNIKIKGTGFDESEAISNAISSVDINAKIFNTFINTGKSRILEYYEKNYLKIIENAKSLASLQKYEEAIALLSIYPSSLPSYSKVSSEMIAIYKQYQNVTCKKMIQEAKGYIAIKDYKSAISILSNIDPESGCKSECTTLINAVKEKLDADEARQIDMNLKAFDSNVELEKLRIRAASDIAKAYYNSKPTIPYVQIIK